MTRNDVALSSSTMPTINTFDRLFRPRSIAFVGASENGLAGMTFGNMLQDFPGDAYPINPNRDSVLGVPTVRSLDDLPEPVDLAVFLVPARLVPGMVEECAERGVGGVVLLSSGFAEAGDSGRSYQAAVVESSRTHKLPVLGPNCNGYFNGHACTYPTFAIPPGAARPKAGSVAVVSQSGGFGAYIVVKAVERALQVGWYVSTGNEADLNVSRALRYLVERPEVQVLLTFSEALRDPEAFIAAAERAAELDKVIISVKTGNSEAAARAALSHTASVVGSEEVFDSVCRQYGILRANSIEEMIDFASLLQSGKRMTGKRLGVVTPSGGAGVLIADAATKLGLSVPELPRQDQATLAPLIPAFGSVKNPVDTTAGLSSYSPDPDTYGKLVRVLDDSDAVDCILTLLWSATGPEVDAVVEIDRASKKPIVAVTTQPASHLSEAGLPTFGDPTRAVGGVSALARVSSRRPARPRLFQSNPDRATQARDLLARAAAHSFVLESTAKRILALYGIPVCREITVHDAESAARAAVEIGGPVALKALSYELPHKSDSGGLRLNLQDADQVRQGYGELVGELADTHPEAVIEGVLVQEMLGANIEIALGFQRDLVFGPTVAIGLGGTLVELMRKPVLLRAPFVVEESRRAVNNIADGLIRHARRGLAEDQVDALAAAMMGLSELALELPEVTSVDINPIRVSRDRMAAVDGLLVLS